jgi:hypothetical protein
VSLPVLPARAHSAAIEAAARALELMAKLLPEQFQGFLRPLDSARTQDSIGPAAAQTHSIADEAKHERIGLLAARREPETAEATFDECARIIATLRDEGLTLSLPVDAAERLFTLGFALEQMREELRDLDCCAIELPRRR